MKSGFKLMILGIICLITMVGLVSADDAKVGYTSEQGIEPDLLLKFNANDCTDLNCAGQTFGLEDPEAPDTWYAGTYDIGDYDITLNVLSEGVISWTSTAKINCIYLKGGNPSAGDNYNYSAYCYDNQHAPIASDSRLSTPLNPQTNEPFQISHIIICYDNQMWPPPPPVPEFPTVALPTGMLIGIIGLVYFIKSREN